MRAYPGLCYWRMSINLSCQWHCEVTHWNLAETTLWPFWIPCRSVLQAAVPRAIVMSVHQTQVLTSNCKFSIPNLAGLTSGAAWCECLATFSMQFKGKIPVVFQYSDALQRCKGCPCNLLLYFSIYGPSQNLILSIPWVPYLLTLRKSHEIRWHDHL